MMNDKVDTEVFVLEWSPSQHAFHIQQLVDALEANQRRFSHRPGDMFDWVPLFVGTYVECESVARHNEWKLKKRLEREQEELAIQWTH